MRRLRQKLSIDVRRKIPGSSKKINFLGQLNTDYDFTKIKNNLQTNMNGLKKEQAVLPSKVQHKVTSMIGKPE